LTGNRSGNLRSDARGWPYVIVGVVFAGVLGWISYTDALFVARLAGNDGGIAYAYPTVPDGLLFFSLLALTEAARAGDDRPRWATAGLVLGAGMTLAANAGAGLGHSILDAVIDGLIPVCFFIAVEIVLWHIRRGRGAVNSSIPRGSPAASPHASLPTVRGIQDRQKCSPTTAKKIRAEVAADRRGRGGAVTPSSAVMPPVPAAHDVPAAVFPRSAAGTSPNGKVHG
jgi:Protein of unknown function (DUF2637)